MPGLVTDFVRHRPVLFSSLGVEMTSPLFVRASEKIDAPLQVVLDMHIRNDEVHSHDEFGILGKVFLNPFEKIDSVYTVYVV